MEDWITAVAGCDVGVAADRGTGVASFEKIPHAAIDRRANAHAIGVKHVLNTLCRPRDDSRLASSGKLLILSDQLSAFSESPGNHPTSSTIQFPALCLLATKVYVTPLMVVLRSSILEPELAKRKRPVPLEATENSVDVPG